ncbi:MAG: dihydrolipoamide acetyltransferase family protein, partial [Ornithinimicrobium sp.]
VETAKSLVELPIPYDGVVRKLLVAEGDTVEVGNPIIDIDAGESGSEGPADADSADVASEERADDMVPSVTSEEPEAAAPEAPKREANLVGYGPSVGATTRRRRRGQGTVTQEPETTEAQPRPKAKPPVRKYAKDRGVDLALVQPTREDGVISRADIDAHVSGTSSHHAATPAAAASSTAPLAVDTPHAASSPTAGETAYAPPVFDHSGARETRTPVKGVRKMTATAMVGSAFTAPHVTEFITVDVSATMDLVERLKSERDFRDLKVSPLLILAKAMVVAVRRNPGVNAVWDEAAGEIVQRHYLNLGIAAATPRGLIVPNIKDADRMDLAQLAAAMQDLVVTARSGRTQPAQMSGGTITITNVGVFGIDTGTPIINPGESAIVCFGAVRRQPWVVTTTDGRESIEPRWVTQLSVSFDHRLIDGELGSRFLADLAALMQDPARALVWG